MTETAAFRGQKGRIWLTSFSVPWNPSRQGPKRRGVLRLSVVLPKSVAVVRKGVRLGKFWPSCGTVIHEGSHPA
jgi:hypothetical protein